MGPIIAPPQSKHSPVAEGGPGVAALAGVAVAGVATLGAVVACDGGEKSELQLSGTKFSTILFRDTSYICIVDLPHGFDVYPQKKNKA